MASESPIRVAIDLETTGLLLESESIIEIGAVKFQGDEVLGTFETFVDPRRPIPYRIQRLTHITPPMLLNAPQLADIAPKLREFLGDAPLVGHNVAFDASFLHRYHIAERNALLDTFELASLLLPSLPSYSLESVAASLGLSAPVHHRALADAELSRAVLVALEAHITALPDPALNELCQLASPARLPMLALLRREQQQRERQSGSSAAALGTGTLGGLLKAQLHVNPAVLGTRVAALGTPAPDLLPIAGGSAGEHVLPAPALRAATREALESGATVMMQAAPGQQSQGEVLAEALSWAIKTQKRIVIATATAAQARELYTHQLPRMLDTFPAPAQQVACAMLFEARDYLCPHRWYGPAREVANLTADALRGIAKMTLWMYETEHGARDEITLGPTEQVAWDLTRAGTNFVALPNCAYRDRQWCFALRAQAAARAAQIVVTTHAALLSADGIAQTDPRKAYVPPADGYLMLDAQQLTERIVLQSSWEVTSEALLAQLDMLWHRGERQPQGLLVRAASAIPGGVADQWSNQIARARNATTAFFATLTTLLAEPRNERSDENYSTALRLDAGIRALPAWGGLIEAWSDLERRLGALADATAQAARSLAKQPGADALALELTAESQQLRQIIQQGRESLEQPRDQFVYWVRPPQNLGWQRNRPQGTTEAPTLHEAPAQVAMQVGPALHRLPGGVVLVGSALVVDGRFEQTREHFGLPATVQVLREPADFTNQTMLLVPSDAPEPNAPLINVRSTMPSCRWHANWGDRPWCCSPHIPRYAPPMRPSNRCSNSRT